MKAIIAYSKLEKSRPFLATAKTYYFYVSVFFWMGSSEAALANVLFGNNLKSMTLLFTDSVIECSVILYGRGSVREGFPVGNVKT